MSQYLILVADLAFKSIFVRKNYTNAVYLNFYQDRVLPQLSLLNYKFKIF